MIKSKDQRSFFNILRTHKLWKNFTGISGKICFKVRNL